MTEAHSHSFKLNRTKSLLLGATVLGVLAFAIGVAQSPQHAWKIFLVNFLFWSGISISGVVFSAIFQLTKARWAIDRVRTVAESFACFLPLSLLLYLLLMVLGAGSLYPWITDPPPGRAAWFTLPFLGLRDGIALLLLYGVGGKFVLASRQAEGKILLRPPICLAWPLSPFSSIPWFSAWWQSIWSCPWIPTGSAPFSRPTFLWETCVWELLP